MRATKKPRTSTGYDTPDDAYQEKRKKLKHNPKHDGIELLRGCVKSARAEIAKYAEWLKNDPHEALGWVSSAVRQAAEIPVFSYVIDAFDGKVARAKGNDPATAESVLKYARAEVFRIASYGAPRSSGFLAVEQHAEMLKAWAYVVEVMEGGA